MENFNLEVKIELEDFQNSNYEEIIKTAKEDQYLDYVKVLFEAAQKEKEKGDDKKAKVFLILSNICSLCLKAEDLKEPYSPLITGTRRSFSLEDLKSDDIEFLNNIVEECNNFRLQGRIADILWQIKEKKNIRHLELAVENYIKFPMDKDNFYRDSRECLERAIRLSMLAKHPMNELHKFLLKVFDDFKLEDNFCCLKIANLLLLSKIDINKNPTILEKLELFADNFSKLHDYFKVEQYNIFARDWYKKIGDIENENRITVKIAENFLDKAKSRKDSQFVRAHFYEKALQEYRKIPKKFRDKYNVDEKLKEIYKLMSEANKLASSEFHVLQTEPIDCSELILNSMSKIKNKNINEAVIALINISEEFNFEEIRESNQKSSVLELISKITYSNDGRVIGKTSGASNKNNDDDEYLTPEIITAYGIKMGLVSQCFIIPALEQFLIEHTISKKYVIDLCSECWFIPKDRVLIWVEGLYFGFEKNFLTSTHLLIPQIEHLVRTLLKEENVQTTVVEPTGIEMEKSLNKLLEEPKLEGIFDENLIYFFKILLIEQTGYNLRNNVMHGLNSQDDFLSGDKVFLWWRILKLVAKNSGYLKE